MYKVGLKQKPTCSWDFSLTVFGLFYVLCKHACKKAQLLKQTILRESLYVQLVCFKYSLGSKDSFENWEWLKRVITSMLFSERGNRL